MRVLKGINMPDEGIVRFHALDTLDVLADLISSTVAIDYKLHRYMIQKRQLRRDHPELWDTTPNVTDKKANFSFDI